MGKWDLFEIFDAREDNYTNMLHFLYETEISFRAQFLKLIFGKDVEGVKFKTRTAYRREKNGKNVPDIILHNRNNFAIIEVKVFSDEGYQQTERYFEASKDIMKELGVDANCSPQYFFLTIYGTEPACKKFQKLKWSRISECMNPDDCTNEMAKMLMSQFKERIKSIHQKDIALAGLWEEQVHSYLWSGSIRFYAALEYLFKQLNTDELFKNNNIRWHGTHWTGFKQASNSYSHSALFYPEDGHGCALWQGITLDEAMSGYQEDDYKNTSRCYDYHFEFEWYEAERLLTMRLDSHLNPYMSKKDVDRIENARIKQFAMDCNKERAKKARENRANWFRTAPEEYRKCYNAHITSTLMTLVTVEYTNDKLNGLSVKEVLALIRPFIETGTRFITEYVLPTKRSSAL